MKVIKVGVLFVQLDFFFKLCNLMSDSNNLMLISKLCSFLFDLPIIWDIRCQTLFSTWLALCVDNLGFHFGNFFLQQWSERQLLKLTYRFVMFLLLLLFPYMPFHRSSFQVSSQIFYFGFSRCSLLSSNFGYCCLLCRQFSLSHFATINF